MSHQHKVSLYGRRAGDGAGVKGERTLCPPEPEGDLLPIVYIQALPQSVGNGFVSQ